MSALWQTTDLSAGFNAVEGLIRDVNFTMQPRERVALLGGERSGTYMLLRVLCGLRPRRSGAMQVLGESVPLIEYYEDWDHIFTRELRARLGVALEKEGLLGNVSLWEGLRTVQRFGGLKSTDSSGENLRRLLRQFGLDEVSGLRPHLLSSAERRFASLVRAALHSPEAYVLEGPTKNLEEQDRSRLFEVCDEWFLGTQPRSLVVATDDWLFARRYCPRLVVMEKGAVVFDGSWQQLPAALPRYWSSITTSLQKRWEWESPLRMVV